VGNHPGLADDGVYDQQTNTRSASCLGHDRACGHIQPNRNCCSNGNSCLNVDSYPDRHFCANADPSRTYGDR
jgi:hypothetical protein